MRKSLSIILILILASFASYGQCDVCDIKDPTPFPSRIGTYYSQYKTICVTKNTTVTAGLNLDWYNTIEVCDGAILTIKGSMTNTSGRILINGNSKVHIEDSYDDWPSYFGSSVDVNGPDCNESFKVSGVYQPVDNCNITLPISLGDFNAFQNKKNKVTIEWATLSEINNSHFHIERSIDLKKWTVIGKVEGNGTTKNPLDYTTTDQNPYKGINYYRLTQYAYNNDKETFRSVAVNYKSSAKGHDIYPNPVKKKYTSL